MRKTIIAICTILLTSMVFSAQHEINFRSGTNFSDSYDKAKDPNGVEVNNGKKDDLGVEYIIEYHYEIFEGFKLGGGIGYQHNGKLKGKRTETKVHVPATALEAAHELETIVGYEDTAYFNSIPIYGTMKYEYPISDKISVFGKLNLGYSINLGQDEITYVDKQEKDFDHGLDKFVYYHSEKVPIKVSNGFLYGIGGGVTYRKMTFDLIFQQTFADVKIDGKKNSLNHTRLTLGIGLTVDLFDLF